MSRGKLIVVSGFSGAGKGTVMKEIMNKYDNYALSVSATTRSPRPGEVEGISYFFKTDDEFRQMIEKNELIEYAGYVGHYYGTPKHFVEKNLDEGKDVFLEIEIQGALKVKEKYPDAVLMFITPPDAKTLRERLVNRGTESMDVIEKRLARAAEEANGVEAYDYIVINDNLQECVEMVDRIVKCEHNRTSERMSIINSIRNDLSK
ncbi:MAG: guanylate kinase [Butyrivibrio sp.]|nr:guanylate kinase [Butyrivibrio sp.]